MAAGVTPPHFPVLDGAQYLALTASALVAATYWLPSVTLFYPGLQKWALQVKGGPDGRLLLQYHHDLAVDTVMVADFMSALGDDVHSYPARTRVHSRAPLCLHHYC